MFVIMDACDGNKCDVNQVNQHQLIGKQCGSLPNELMDVYSEPVVALQFTRICSLGLRITEAMVDLPASALQTIIATQQVALGLGNIGTCRTRYILLDVVIAISK